MQSQKKSHMRKRSKLTTRKRSKLYDVQNKKLSFHTPKSRKKKLPRSKHNDKKTKQKIYNLLKSLLNKKSPRKTRKIPRNKVHSKDLKKPGGWRAVQRELNEKRALEQITDGITNLLNKTLTPAKLTKTGSKISSRSPQYINAVLRNAGLLKKKRK